MNSNDLLTSNQPKSSNVISTNPRALEIRANRHAELFVEAYYSIYDSKSRVNKLVEFYRSDARIVWNGNAISNLTIFSSSLLSQLSFSKHEIQSFDAHAIPGSIVPPSILPTLSITVTGQVLFSSQPFPSTFKMPDAKDISPNQNPVNLKDALNGLPRVFSQTFILIPSNNNLASEPNTSALVSNYSIIADCFRFVG
ncbi:hypothetical protein O181_045969 [Austropuccinia psidii MF-1]|uniref:NTF2 domain-containing protein n=1 Tax=Austropuccinia psidii MF-1 TaxID=1389203 RepID=A0A9Q3DN17_9BASI|nr:hypothetical protein [Austropuccinia psidii MF-1]